MKLVHICQYYNDGYGYQENLLPKYQAKLGHEVLLITSDRCTDFTFNRKSRIIGTGTYSDNGFVVRRIPIKWEFKNRFVKFKSFKAVLIEEKPDYVFHHGIWSPALDEIVKYKNEFNKKLLIAIDNHAEAENSGRNSLWKKLYHEIFIYKKFKRVEKFVDKIFSISPPTKDFAVSAYKINSEKIELLPLGADVDSFKSDEKARDKIRNKFGFSEEDLVIITAGKFEPRKRTEILINAVKGIKGVKLLIVGSGLKEYLNLLKKLAEDSENIIFTGWIDYNELPNYFVASDIAIWPGKQTALFQNAIGLGLPVIIKEFPGIEYILDGNGFALKTGKVEELKQKIIHIRNNRHLLERFKKRSLEITEERLSYYAIARKSVQFALDMRGETV